MPPYESFKRKTLTCSFFWMDLDLYTTATIILETRQFWATSEKKKLLKNKNAETRHRNAPLFPVASPQIPPSGISRSCVDAFVKDPVPWLRAEQSSDTLCVQAKLHSSAYQLFLESFNVENIKTLAHNSSNTLSDPENPAKRWALQSTTACVPKA